MVDPTQVEQAKAAASVWTACSDKAACACVKQRAGDEIGAIFEAQALFARDPGIIGPALDAIESPSVGEYLRVSFAEGGDI